MHLICIKCGQDLLWSQSQFHDQVQWRLSQNQDNKLQEEVINIMSCKYFDDKRFIFICRSSDLHILMPKFDLEFLTLEYLKLFWDTEKKTHLSINVLLCMFRLTGKPHSFRSDKHELKFKSQTGPNIGPTMSTKSVLETRFWTVLGIQVMHV